MLSDMTPPSFLLTLTCVQKQKLPRQCQRECPSRIRKDSGYGIALAVSPLFPRRRHNSIQTHKRGPDKVYNRKLVKNITCGAKTASLIKTKPKTNAQIGRRLRRSVLFRLKY